MKVAIQFEIDADADSAQLVVSEIIQRVADAVMGGGGGYLAKAGNVYDSDANKIGTWKIQK